MTLFTVFGSTGFIGRHMAAALKRDGHDVQTPARGDALPPRLGHAVYAVGLTGDYRSRPFDTIDAHVGGAARILQAGDFASFTYLSSTRVYRRHASDRVAREDDLLSLDNGFDSIYDCSKLYGEALCLGTGNPAVRVARLSNVYGRGMSAGSFLGAVVASLAETGQVVIDDHPQSAKDYISVDDAVRALCDIAQSGRQRVYNVATGRNIANQDIADALASAGYRATFSGKTVQPRVLAPVSAERYAGEFAPLPPSLIKDIPTLVSIYKETPP